MRPENARDRARALRNAADEAHERLPRVDLGTVTDNGDGTFQVTAPGRSEDYSNVGSMIGPDTLTDGMAVVMTTGANPTILGAAPWRVS